MPAQSGNTAVLDRMNRKYTQEAYRELIARARCIIPGISLSTDIIAGFCGETEAEFEDTMRLMEDVKFDFVVLIGLSLRLLNAREDLCASHVG